MGQTNFVEGSSHLKRMEEDWKPHPFENNVFCHTKSKMQVQRYLIIPTEKEKQIFLKRLRDHHTHIIKVMHCEKVTFLQKNGERKEGMFVFVQRVFKVIKKDWKTTQTALSILKGFRRLSSSFGFFRVSKEMIGINSQGEVKLWIHEIPIVFEPQNFVDSQKKMLEGLIRMIAQNDPEVGLILAGVSSFNEAINNILIDLSKINSQYTQRHKFVGMVRNQGMLKENKRILFTRKIRPEKKMNDAQNFGNKSWLNHKKEIEENCIQKTIISPIIQRVQCFKVKSKNNLRNNKFYNPSINEQMKNQGHHILEKNKQESSVRERKRHSSNDFSNEGINLQNFKRFQTQNVDQFCVPNSQKYSRKLVKKKSQVKLTKKAIYLKPTNLKQFQAQEQETVIEELQIPNIKIRNVVRVNADEPMSLWENETSDEKERNQTTKQSLQIGGKSKKFQKYLEIEKFGRLNQSESYEIKNEILPKQQQLSKQISKKDFSKKLRMEFGQILSLSKNEEDKEPLDEKSRKDLQIKKKINKKKETFAELKKEAMKLLDQQLQI